MKRLDTAHTSQIREIARCAFPVLWSEKDFNYFLLEKNGLCLGAFEGERLLCYCLALLAQGDLDIVSVATAESSRRQGIAKKLIREMEENPAVKRLYLEVEDSNVSAIKLYEGIGFRRYGLRKKYYQGVKDAVLMMKEKRRL